MDTELRMGVIGVGHLGQHHARVYAELDGCRLVGVCDPDQQRGRDVAARHATRYAADVS
jgi:predicted dehydrogenase